jgi:acyl carrier protein
MPAVRPVRGPGGPGAPTAGRDHKLRGGVGRPKQLERPHHAADEDERIVVPAETHVEQSPLDRQAVLDLIRDRLSDILEVEPTTINEGDSFADDLEADSLALIELVEALEEELGERSVGFRIEDEDLEDLKTVRDAVDYVLAKLG